MHIISGTNKAHKISISLHDTGQTNRQETASQTAGRPPDKQTDSPTARETNIQTNASEWQTSKQTGESTKDHQPALVRHTDKKGKKLTTTEIRNKG